MTIRVVRTSALLAVVFCGLVAGPAMARTARPEAQSWLGQVQRHHGHFDYVGRPCPEQEDVCVDYVARYRDVPTTRQAERGLRRAAGQWARLWGELVPAGDAGHQGTLRVSRVQPRRSPPPWATSGVESAGIR